MKKKKPQTIPVLSNRRQRKECSHREKRTVSPLGTVGSSVVWVMILLSCHLLLIDRHSKMNFLRFYKVKKFPIKQQ